MRKNANLNSSTPYKILGVDDETGILDSLKVYLTKARVSFYWYLTAIRSNRKIKRRTLWFTITRLYYDTCSWRSSCRRNTKV